MRRERESRKPTCASSLYFLLLFSRIALVISLFLSQKSQEHVGSDKTQEEAGEAWTRELLNFTLKTSPSSSSSISITNCLTSEEMETSKIFIKIKTEYVEANLLRLKPKELQKHITLIKQASKALMKRNLKPNFQKQNNKHVSGGTIKQYTSTQHEKKFIINDNNLEH